MFASLSATSPTLKYRFVERMVYLIYCIHLVPDTSYLTVFKQRTYGSW